MSKSPTAEAVRRTGGSIGNLHNIALDRLEPNPGNIRHDTQTFRDGIVQFAAKIAREGFNRTQVLRVRPHAEKPDTWVVESGNRRLMASLLAAANGSEILTLPCIIVTDKLTEEERLRAIVRDGDGVKYTSAEYADVIRKYRSFGWDDTRIAAYLDYSRQWIVNIMAEANLPDDMQTLIADESISPTEARRVAREHGPAAAQVIREAKERTGRAQVSRRHLRAATPAPEPERNSVTPETAPDPTPDLRTAARAVLACWDTGNLDDAWTAAIADLRRAAA